MRPEILFPLFAPVTDLPGIGARLAKPIEKLAGPTVVDLCWHLPTGVIDRRYRPTMGEAVAVVRTGGPCVATLAGTVEAHRPPSARGRPYKVILADGNGFLDLVFFNPRPDWLLSQLPIGEIRVVSGRIEIFAEKLQLVHPDHILTPDQADSLPAVEPVYPLAGGLTAKTLARPMAAALERVPDLPDWLDEPLRRREGWPGWADAIRTVHRPDGQEALQPDAPARRRLAYDEMLANQLALALVRGQRRRTRGRTTVGDGTHRDAAASALPFTLTDAQHQAIADIIADMATDTTMVRLLQGDVGSGKTIVAAFAMLAAVEAGGQAALMAPTEILARQHFHTLAGVAGAAGVQAALLTGQDSAASRRPVLGGLADGSIGLVVGTHALVQKTVAFRDLRLAVIDEQHRFGVDQRLALADKGPVEPATGRRSPVDMLAMTATPIPRSLLMTAYGDLDVSRLAEKPAGRKPVDTRAVPMARLDAVADAAGRAMARGDKVFWVCPLVAESEQLDLAAAEQRYAALSHRFPGRVALVHGRQKSKEKQEAMAAFAADASGNTVDLLVATTVIEVGVDVPAAAVMVIEHAERFGLAQLHQLRGRIGRGDKPGTCLLLYAGPLGDTARARLTVLRDSDDGFVIAEQDLNLRGGGDVLGTRQSGLPTFRVADVAAHRDLLSVARDDARLVCDRDPDLTSERGRALRILLYLFEYDAAIRTLRSG